MSPQREHRATEWSGGGDLKLPEEREWGPEGWRGIIQKDTTCTTAGQCRCRLILRDLTGRFYL